MNLKATVTPRIDLIGFVVGLLFVKRGSAKKPHQFLVQVTLGAFTMPETTLTLAPGEETEVAFGNLVRMFKEQDTAQVEITDLTTEKSITLTVNLPENVPLVDVLVQNEGSIFLFRPQTDAAKEWIDQNVSDEAQWFGGGLVVEHRYAHDMAEGMAGSGLTVR